MDALSDDFLPGDDPVADRFIFGGIVDFTQVKKSAPFMSEAQNVVGDVHRVQHIDVVSKPRRKIDQRRPIGF